MLKINRKGDHNFGIIVAVVLTFAVIFLIIGGTTPIFGSFRNTTQTLSKCSGMGFINGNCVPRTASCVAKFENLGCPSDKPVCCFDKTEGGGGSVDPNEKSFCLCQDTSKNIIATTFNSADDCAAACTTGNKFQYCKTKEIVDKAKNLDMLDLSTENQQKIMSVMNSIQSISCVSGSDLSSMRAACLSADQALKQCYDALVCTSKLAGENPDCAYCRIDDDKCKTSTI
jgi:hypothetical protein